MKRSIVIIVCLIVAIFCTKCYNDPTYEAVINCYYSSNNEKGEPVSDCLITIGNDDFADFAIREDFTDGMGQYKTTFRYEAFFEVKAQKEEIEYIDGDSIPVKYVGEGKLKLIPNEVATLDILLTKE